MVQLLRLDPQGSRGLEPFSRLFPCPVGAAVVALPGHVPPLFAEEEEAVVKAVAKRRIEFAAGRHCARSAMAQLGWPACAIPSGSDRAPIWPPGLAGSITHSAGMCAAVVAPVRHLRTIGIDMEPIDAVPQELKKVVLRADELAAFDRQDRPDGADTLTLLFCLKEAAYKAFYPRFRQIIEFRDMRIRLDRERAEFRAEPCVDVANRDPTFSGRYAVAHGRVYAACWCQPGFVA